MKTATTILHAAHDKFSPYWRFDPEKDLLSQIPSFDAATVRSRDPDLEVVPDEQRKDFESYPATLKKPTISVYNLLNEVIYFNRTADFESEKLVNVKWSCETKPQIMICLHGYAHDAVNGYARKGTQEHKIHYRSLAYFIYNLICDRSTPLMILLSMCYAARSETYRKDHEDLDNLTDEDIESSFAYRFTKELARKKPDLVLRLTARTGALKFDYETGESLVQSEEAILASEYLRDLRNEIREVEEVNSRGLSISDMIDLQANFAKQQAKLRKVADPEPKERKYGKFIYEVNREDDQGKFSIKVSSKYPDKVLLRKI